MLSKGRPLFITEPDEIVFIKREATTTRTLSAIVSDLQAGIGTKFVRIASKVNQLTNKVQTHDCEKKKKKKKKR